MYLQLNELAGETVKIWLFIFSSVPPWVLFMPLHLPTIAGGIGPELVIDHRRDEQVRSADT